MVTSDPFRFIRHPIYAAILLFTWTRLAVHLSLINILLGLLITAGAATRIYCEEHALRKHYPDDETYAQKNRRVIPGVLQYCGQDLANGQPQGLPVFFVRKFTILDFVIDYRIIGLLLSDKEK